MTDPNNLDFTVPDPWGDLPGYALDALSEEERARVDALLEESPEARDELRRLMETVESLSVLASSAEPSARVRRNILAQADSDIHLMDIARQEAKSLEPVRPSFLKSLFRPARAAYTGAAAAVISVVALATVFGIQNARLSSEVDDLKNELQADRTEVVALRDAVTEASNNYVLQEAEMARLSNVNSGLNEALKDLQWLTYVTQNREYRVPEYLVGSAQAPEANGTLAVKNFDDLAVLLVSSLPVAPDGYEYLLSLVRDGEPESVATFQVNDAGQARVEFDLPDNISQYESAVVTLKPVDGDVQLLSGPPVMTAAEPGN